MLPLVKDSGAIINQSTAVFHLSYLPDLRLLKLYRFLFVNVLRFFALSLFEPFHLSHLFSLWNRHLFAVPL